MTTSEGRAVEVEKALEYIAKWKAEYPRIVQPEKWQAPIIALGEEYEILRVRVAEVERELESSHQRVMTLHYDVSRALDCAEREGSRAETAERRVDDMTPLARLGEWALERIRGVYAGDVDAFDVQEKATTFGVIAPQTAPKPCGECCVCEEMDADVCYRDTDATTRALRALAAAGDDTTTNNTEN